MDRSLKWRIIALLLGCMLCVGILMPSFMSKDQLPSWFPFEKKINLGLDLQGGLHIVYSIDLDKAIDDKATEIKRDLEARFSEEKTAAVVKTPSAPLGAVYVSLTDQTKREAALSAIKADYGDETSALDCPASEPAGSICIRVSSDYADGIKKAALTNAVATIRERIDEKGVAEPTVVEKGDEILVELPGLDKDAIQETRDIIARTAKLEFKVVDENSEYMKRLYAHVGSEGKENRPTDPAAIAADIQAEIDQWRPEDGGGMRTDYFLMAHDREQALTIEEAKLVGCLNKDNKDKVENGRIKCNVSGRRAIELYLFGDKKLNIKGLADTDPTFKVPDGREISFEYNEPNPDAKDKRPYWRTYYLDRDVRLTGSGISNAMGSYDPNTNRPIVLLDFNRYGSRVFGNLTAEIVGKKLATILDGKVKSAPIINGAIRGGRASITMGGSDVTRMEKERNELVNVLKTGSLPAPLHEESSSEVGPSLGRDAIEKTRLSFILGIALVVLIMVGIYRWSGWISVFAVVFHIVMTLAVMAAFGATLTLPGIAAIVLSIGMEVDGNILIYERIRDELLLGKSVRGAVDLGFSRAFSAILDGQLTTAAAGWVLLQYGSGPIKGFAVMLLVGVFTTLSTNIWVTRIFFDWYVSRKKGTLATISIEAAMSEHHKFRYLLPPGNNFAFVTKFKAWLIFSIIAMSLAVGALFLNKSMRGDYMNWTIDFKGGSEIIVAFKDSTGSYTKVDPGKVRETLEKDEHGIEVSDISWSAQDKDGKDVTVNGMIIRTTRFSALKPETAAAVVADFNTTFKDRDISKVTWSGDRLSVRSKKPVTPEQAEPLFKKHGLDLKKWSDEEINQYGHADEGTGEYNQWYAIFGLDRVYETSLEKAFTGIDVNVVQSYGVGAKAGDKLRNDAAKAIVYAIFLIMLYLAFRFDIRYAPGAAFATIHDAVMVIGVFAVTWTEVSLTSVAGLLTVMGFSVNDTVIVFDRIRENQAKLKDKKIERIIDISINEMLVRTILTSSTVFATTLIMNIFGTGLVKNFAFAMNVGVIVGCYSSIFLAVPFFMWISKKWYSGPAPARRRLGATPAAVEAKPEVESKSEPDGDEE